MKVLPDFPDKSCRAHSLHTFFSVISWGKRFIKNSFGEKSMFYQRLPEPMTSGWIYYLFIRTPLKSSFN